MDASAFFLQHQSEQDDLAELEEEEFEVQRAAVMVLIGADASRLLRNEQRLERRTYLRRQELPRNPRDGTAWQALYQSKSDRAFITTMGFDVDTFGFIVESGFGLRWQSEPIPRDDTNSLGEPRAGARSLDAYGALGLVLHYLNSTMSEISLQQLFGLVPATVSRYVRFGIGILLTTLRSMKEAEISWPKSHQEFEELSNLITARHPRLHGAFASIDGLNLPVQESADPVIENETYNGWLSEHFVSSVIVFSPKGEILAVNANAPGSWHDSRVAQPIFQKLSHETPDGFYLIADTAFPRGAQDIQDRIIAPLKSGQKFRGTREDIEERAAFDRELLSYRQTAEWGMRLIQGSFGRLRLPLPINDKDYRADLLETCFRAANLRTRRVGHNEIREVYMKEWTQNQEDMYVWQNFEDMLFGDQIKKDRVSRYHLELQYVR